MMSRARWLVVCGLALLIVWVGNRRTQPLNADDDVPLPVISRDCSAPPGPPVDLQFVKTGSQVRGTWQSPTVGEAPTWFAVEIGSRSGLRDLGTHMVPAARTELSGPMPPGVFFVRVYSRNGCGSSAASNEIEIVVP